MLKLSSRVSCRATDCHLGACTPTDCVRHVRQVFVAGEFIGGCDTTIEMYKSGELRDMLKEAGAK